MSLTKRNRVLQHEGRLILYTLQRKWGVPADFYKVTVDVTFNSLESGNKGVTRTKYSLPSFISCSVDLIRKFEYDIGFLAANKNFTYGGFYEPGDRLAVIDARDLPEGTKFEQKDYFIHDNKRYDVQRIEAFDHQIGWMVHLRATKENKPYAIVNRYVEHRLLIEQETDATL